VVSRADAAKALASLARIARRYEPGLGARKLALLRRLSTAKLATPRQLLRFHELLCFLDAYPDDRRVRGLARRLLTAFRRRPDLRRHRAALAGSGIAGTDTPYRFFWPTARWISTRWPGALVIDREDPEHVRAILDALPQLLEPVSAELLRRLPAPTLDILDRLRPQGMTDADYLISLVSAMPGDDTAREALFDRVDPPFRLRAGTDTPERTTARFDRLPLHYRQEALRGPRPKLALEARRRPQRVKPLKGADARALISLARISMATRERDLAVFQFANPNDAFLVDDGRGLGFAMVGMRPERRAFLPAIYGGLTLQNGVPIGYIQVDILGRHAELSFNTFETFRGADAAHVFARLVAAVHHVFRCDSFSIEPYQLGIDNEEGIKSGAWWFYFRFGFRPRDAASRRIAGRELDRVARNRRYRSSPRTLRSLARTHLYYSLAPERVAALPRVPALLEAGATELARFRNVDADDRRAAAVTAAQRQLRVSTSTRARPAVKRMLEQWAPVVLALLRRSEWSATERRQLLRLVESKAGASEREYLERLLRHRRLRRVLDC
jgi:hypothetical protein